ncbi:hypothetical protein HRbin40_02393 [bacterium HR40]|nr:hypothetical protein HRbin40_02393 [bacterium HR40]
MPAWLDRLGAFVERTSGFWRWLGELESRLFADELAAVPIDRPIYVAGLARAGTTILLELLAASPGVATHRYRDFPLVFAPIFWNRAFAHVYRSDAPPTERAHRDRILVTPDSPEAMEEPIWMHFFPHLHDPQRCNVLDRRTAHPAFERFYRDHIRKILLIRGGQRYLSKGNYNLVRFGYLAKLFPDARFLVPVRDPRWHVASLIKQHRLFCAEEERDPRILAHMRRAGHFEFGQDLRPIHVGDQTAAAEIRERLARGELVAAFARYWALLYGFLLDQLAADADLAARTLLVTYEELCDRPQATLERVFAHVELPLPPTTRDAYAARLSRPTYYAPRFTPEEQRELLAATATVRARLGMAEAA